jgi:hypothetical protein
MIEIPAQRGIIRPWIVCEAAVDKTSVQGAAGRWVTAVRRFAPELMPPPLIPSIVPAEPAQARAMLAGNEQAVILWEVRHESLAAACDCLAAVAMTSPQVLQLLAVAGLSDRERLVLSEFGCATMVCQPEDLPGLSQMIHGYFAITG